MIKFILVHGNRMLGVSVIDVIEQESQFVIVGIVDKPELIRTEVLGYPVIGSDADLEGLAKIYTYALAPVGNVDV